MRFIVSGMKMFGALHQSLHPRRKATDKLLDGENANYAYCEVEGVLFGCKSSSWVIKKYFNIALLVNPLESIIMLYKTKAI